MMIVSSHKRIYLLSLDDQVVYTLCHRWGKLGPRELQKIIDANFELANRQNRNKNYRASLKNRDIAKLAILVKEGGLIFNHNVRG